MWMERSVRVEHLNLQLGTDLVYMPRLLKYLDNQSFLKKILTPNELEIYQSLKHEKRKLEFLCGRYACKEAYAKAIGTGIGDVDFLDFEVLKDEKGKPISNKGMVSISHDEDYAIAVVILYE